MFVIDPNIRSHVIKFIEWRSYYICILVLVKQKQRKVILYKSNILKILSQATQFHANNFFSFLLYDYTF